MGNKVYWNITSIAYSVKLRNKGVEIIHKDKDKNKRNLSWAIRQHLPAKWTERQNKQKSQGKHLME